MTQRNDCPVCGNRTFHETPTGRRCSRCPAEDTWSPGQGRGEQCRNCRRWMVFENQGVMTCRNCGTRRSS